MGRTIMSDTPSVQWKNIFVLQIIQNHCYAAEKELNLTIIKLLNMTTYMCCSYNTTTFRNYIGTHIFTTTGIY